MGHPKFNYLESRHGPSGVKVYKVYINDDPGLTLTYFTARSSLVRFAYCALTRLRYAYSAHLSDFLIVLIPD